VDADGLLGALLGVEAAVELMARIYAAETASTKLRVNIFNPGPVRTRMRATAMPGEDPMTLDVPENVAEKIVDLCLPGYTQTGTLYNYRVKKFLSLGAAGLISRRVTRHAIVAAISNNTVASMNGAPGS
jgi:NAD(P)-dependent dehydrogenase (short-subunit alcohol dehydrogenase family)